MIVDLTENGLASLLFYAELQLAIITLFTIIQIYIWFVYSYLAYRNHATYLQNQYFTPLCFRIDGC